MLLRKYVLLVALSCGLCEDLKDLNITELIKLGQDISQVRPYEASTSDVQFYIVADLEGVPVLLTSDNTDLVSPDKDTKIIIHGWIENHRRSWYKTIADEYLKINDINFIEVDWENIARLPYISSAKNLKFVGDEIVKFIADMNLSAEKIHVIGHSLGAHVAGIVGKGILEKSGLKLARISGLDPAGPYFRDPLISSKDRLDKNDAEIVDAIHTDAGFYGYESPIGTLDIYVNRGRRVQPGCLSDLTPKSLGEMLTTSFCSHARSTVYFAEWINIGKFKCLFHQRTVSFSSDEVTKDVTGVCYATTNKEEPFLQ
ncbi:pancreatic lipase-related protein 3-like [Sitophilus oryzae]|uniref:Pancreatic lipase-related protein 3-like n=1 Tax=Sitophilus oryzae TaxID=7048 RepID=A0A6J2XWH6_SITOR|nr:pancreatic lipase-related protein 3-like [Sitophilus oryzae]